MKKIAIAMIAALAVFGASAAPASADTKIPFALWMDKTMDDMSYKNYEDLCSLYESKPKKTTTWVYKEMMGAWKKNFKGDIGKPKKKAVNYSLYEWCVL